MTTSPAPLQFDRSPHKLRGLGELVSFLPYLLGYHPVDSIVLVGHNAAGVCATACCDPEGDVATRRELEDLIVAGHQRAAVAQWFDLIAFVDTPAVREQMRSLADRLRADCGPVHHTLAVHPAPAGPGRWELLTCRCGRGCERGQFDLPARDRVPAVADRVLEGHVPASSRQDLADSLNTRPLVGAAVSACDRGMPTPADYAAALLDVLNLGPHARPVEELPVETLASVLHGLCDRDVRDHLLSWLAPHVTGDFGVRPDLTDALKAAGGRQLPPAVDAPPERESAMTERLSALVRCAPRGLVPAPATVLGFWCWVHGGGALATIALDRALTVAPRYRMAELLWQVVQAGLRPEDARWSGPRMS